MHQFETIIAAVELAIQHGVSNAIPAILKEYIMDEHYVAKQDRHELLVLINNKLETKYSLTGIKKGNPVILKTLPFELPEKAVLVRTDKVIGSTEIPADSALISQTNNAAQQGTTEMQTNAQQSQAQESNANAQATEQGNALVQDNIKPGNPSKKDKAKKDKRVEVATEEADMSKAEAKRFAKAFVDAHAKGKVKKADRHVKLAFGMDSIDQFGINVIYAFMRPTVKFMVNAIKELPGMKDADHRATVFETWVKGDEDRAKAFKRFNKRASKVLDKPDHIMAMFLLLSEDNLRTSIEFANFAYIEAEATDTAGDDTYAFVRENSNGVNPRWTAAAGAVIGGTVDMAMNGFDLSAIAGTAVATGGAFFAGGLLEDQIENPHLRDFAAGALGGVMGVGGARIGRNIGRALSDDDETMVEQSDSTVVATIPAQVITQRTEPVNESGGVLTGLAALMAG